MKLSKSLKQFEDQARQHDSYWVERAKLDFSIQLERLRRAKGMTCVALAEKFGRSGAYISKIFRGDSNLTIESMVKLARATGGRLTITVADEKAVSPVDWGWLGNQDNKAAANHDYWTMPTSTITVVSPIAEKFPCAA